MRTMLQYRCRAVLWQRALNKLAANNPEFVSRLHLGASLSKVDSTNISQPPYRVTQSRTIVATSCESEITRSTPRSPGTSTSR